LLRRLPADSLSASALEKSRNLGGAAMRDWSWSRRWPTAAIIPSFVLALNAGPARAQSVADFYKGRNLTFISSSGTGGGYDVYSRVLARFIGRYVPGRPHIVVENMPGAGGITEINYMYNAAARDGSVMADTYSTMPFYLLLDGRNAKFDPRKINWLGSSSRAVSLCLSWGPSSFKTLDDVMRRSMRVSSTGATGWRAVLPHLYNEIAGSKFDVIAGYAENNDYLAVERGEVDGICTNYDTILATRPNWLSQHLINPLVQFGDRPLPGMAQAPMALDHAKSSLDRDAMRLILAQQETGRPYFFPPGVPAGRVAALRAAFERTMKDPDFLEAARRAHLLIDPTSPEAMNRLISSAYASPAATIARARSLLAQALGD
jgi:tripartite-type tricarboxylate transporter receptor subunit TctC